MTRVGLIQSHPDLLDLDQTCARLLPQLRTCAEQDAELVILPELAGSGYAFPDRDSVALAAEANDASGPFLGWLAQRSHEFGFSVITGYAEAVTEAPPSKVNRNPHAYNSAALLDGDGIHAHYRKLHLFDGEKELFTPGDHPANLVLPYAQTAVRGHALCNRVFIATANRIGSEDSLTFTGQSQLIDPHGRILAQAPADQPWAQVLDLDPALSRDKKPTLGNHLFNDRRPDFYAGFESRT